MLSHHNFSYHIKTKMLTDRLTDGWTEIRIYTLLPLIVEYNCVKFQNFLSYRVTTKMLTDGRTDRRTDGQTDNVITIGHPHFMRSPKYDVVYCIWRCYLPLG